MTTFNIFKNTMLIWDVWAHKLNILGYVCLWRSHFGGSELEFLENQ